MHLSLRKIVSLKHLLKGLGENMCILTREIPPTCIKYSSLISANHIHIGLEADKIFFIRYILITLADMYKIFIF